MNKTDQFLRLEAWGQLRYDPDLDEFEALQERQVGELVCDRPISAGCLVTGKCNLECPHCFGNREALPTKELSASDWAHAFEKLKGWGLMRVDISGGEPSTRADLAKILENGIKAGLNVVLSTNGMLFKQSTLKEIPQAVRIHVSVDSGNPLIHEANRRLHSGGPSTNSFDTTSNFLRRCLDEGYRTRVLTAVGSHNECDLLSLGEHLAMLGVGEWNISRILRAGRALNSYAANWEIDDEQMIEQIALLQQTLPWITIRYSNRTRQNGYFLLILPDGSVATQCTDGRDKVIFGQMMTMDLAGLRASRDFNLREHSSKWIARILVDQPPEWVGLGRHIVLAA